MKNIILIGIKNNMDISSKETISQIKKIKNYKLDLVDNNGQIIKWTDLDDSSNKNTIFRAIVFDRKLRVDKENIMADRPNFCAITLIDSVIKRIEYYEGHDELDLVYDIRAKDLINEELERYMEKDMIGYNFDSNFNELNDTYNFDKSDSVEDIVKEFKKLYKIAHEAVVFKKFNKKSKYYAKLSQTLEQHQYEFQNSINKILSNL